jgi:1-acyl-sn-glycerol-3-phosphate acyltransferase
VIPGVQVDGPRPALLPNGPVILVANHPTPGAADLVLSRLAADRRSRTVLVAGRYEHIPRLTRLLRPMVRLDPHDPGRAGIRLHNLLGQGWSALIFPEGDPASGVVKRPFHPFAAELAAGLGLPVVPVGIRGARAVGAGRGPDRVSVRFGEVLPEGVDARAQEAAVDALIAEDRATWWVVQRAEPGHLPQVRPPHSAHTWRHVWAQTAPPTKGGTRESPRIWR